MKNVIKLASAPKISFVPSGKYAGNTCIYIQFSGCNMHCIWQNTNYKSVLCNQYDVSCYPAHQINEYICSVEQIVDFVKSQLQTTNKIYITGGEPFYQPEELLLLVTEIKKIRPHVESFVLVETNGTIGFIDALKIIDYVILSPKLSSSTPWKFKFNDLDIAYSKSYELKHELYRKNLKILYSYTQYCNKNDLDYEVNFLISNESDESEIKMDYYPFMHKVPNNKIYISSLDDDKKTLQTAKNACIRNNWIFSPNILKLD